MKSKFYKGIYAKPIILLLITVVSVFASQIFIRTFLYNESDFYHEMLDATLLSILMTPALYVLLYRPLISNLDKSKEGEHQLTELNQSLEQIVAERSAELTKVNRLLQEEYTEALRLSEERYKNVIENLGLGVAVIAPDMKVVSLNSQMLKWHPLADLEQDQFCYKALQANPGQVVCENCPVAAAITEGKSVSAVVEKVIMGVKRSHKIIASPLFGKDGTVVAVTEVVEDVTEQEKYNKDLTEAIAARTSELAEAERKYRSLVQNSSEGIFILDPVTLQIIEANKQLVKLLGYTETEFLNLRLADLVAAEREDVETNVYAMVTEGKKLHFARQYRKKDGTLLDVEVSGTLITYDNNKVCLVNVRDISEQKQAEAAQRRNVEELRATLESTVTALVQLTEIRDPYTSGHQKRVSKVAVAIAQEMGLPEAEIDSIGLAGMLHDIGKIYVPIDILNKPGRLTENEMAIIRTHPQVAYDVLAPIPFRSNVAELVLQHHEKIDGSGYPQGLKGEDISLGARILGVADVVEAMSSHRPYRPAKGRQMALQEIETNQGIIYDANVVEACVKVFSRQNNLLDEVNNGVA